MSPGPTSATTTPFLWEQEMPINDGPYTNQIITYREKFEKFSKSGSKIST